MDAKRRILIVEDHDLTRNALRGLFRRTGWDVVAVGTVAEGVASLNPPPDFAVLDLMLPDGGGEEVVEAIKRQHLSTCMAVCSGTGDEDRLKAVRGLGVHTVLQKPIQIEDLFSACNATA